MGLFGGTAKADVKPEPMTAESHEEPVEELPSLPKPRSNTVIAKGLTVSGTIEGEGVVQVEGNVEGAIQLNGSVIVTTTGHIKGPVEADVVRVAGFVEGNVTVRDHLRLEKTGNVDGDVTTASLVVEDGGRLNGRSTMVQSERHEPFVPASSIPLEDLQFGPNYNVVSDEEDEEDADEKASV